MSMPPGFSAVPDDDAEDPGGPPAADVLPAEDPQPEEAEQAELPDAPPFRTPDPRRIGPDGA